VAEISAGILLVRLSEPALGAHAQFLLAHPGGPFFAKKDAGAWTIPKGLAQAGEALESAAIREFHEETGGGVALGALHAIGEVRLKGGKHIHGWAALGDCDAASLSSNAFELEWPPRSGRRQTFPELDRYAWFNLADASVALNQAQLPFLARARLALALPG